MIDLASIPPVWRLLVAELNGLPTREPRGPDWEDCEGFVIGEPGLGTCDTDGHYRCTECVEISTREFRRRRSQCEECGSALVLGNPRLGYSSREPDCCPRCNREDVRC